MTEAMRIILVGMAGIGLGALFFGGLWWTVNKCVSSRRPGLLVFVSLILRLGMILAGFYLVAGAHWQRLLACLLGFVVARFIVTQVVPPLIERYKTRRGAPTPEATHAP